MRGAWVLLLVAPLLAGCTGDEPTVSLEALSLSTIQGTVTDPSLVPLQGATIRLDGQDGSVVSDATGAFAFRVAAGEYLALATFDGYRGAALRASPAAGAVTSLAFVLSPLPHEAPAVTLQEKHGLFSCGGAWAMGSSRTDMTCSSDDPNDRKRVLFDVEDRAGLEGAVVEVVWDATTPGAARMLLTIRSGAGEDAVVLAEDTASGHGNIRIPGRILDNNLVAGDALVVEVRPTGSFTDDEAGIDAGFAIQQPFTVYLSLFYHAAPPGDYAVVA